MSVTNETYRVTATLATAAQAIPVTFYFLENNDLVAYQTVAGVDTLMVLNTNYTLTGEGVEAGGTLTTIGGTVGAVWTIARADALTQDEEFIYMGKISPATLERGYDRLTMQVQRLYSKVARALRFPITNAEGGELALNDRKGKLLSFDATTGVPTFTDPLTLIPSDPSVAAAILVETNRATAAEAGKISIQSLRITATNQQIICVGDSLTKGTTPYVTIPYPTALASLPCALGATVSNLGQPSEGITNIVSRYNAEVKPLLQATGKTFNTLIIWVGANDYPTVDTASTYVARIEAYATTAKADSVAPLRVGVVTTMRRADTGLSAAIESIRQQINVLERSSTVFDFVIDADRLFPNPCDYLYFVYGNVHLGDLGNVKLANEINRVLTTQTDAASDPLYGNRLGVQNWLYNDGTSYGSFSPTGAELTAGTGDFTVAFWAMFPTYQTGTASNGGTVLGGQTNSLAIVFLNDGTLSTVKTNVATTGHTNYASFAGKWTHFVLARYLTVTNVYINGNYAHSYFDNNNYSVSSNELFSRNFGDLRYKGYISDFCFAKRAIGFEEVLEIMNTGRLSNMTSVSVMFPSIIAPNGRIKDVSSYNNHVAMPSSCVASNDSIISEVSVPSGSAVTVTNGATINAASLSLGAGKWQIDSATDFNLTGTTATSLNSGISTTSATFGSYGTYVGVPLNLTTATWNLTSNNGRMYLTLTATTTVYLLARLYFSAGTATAGGWIRAKRL
jgi:hypothetical protein